MSDNPNETRNNAIAAAIILLAVGAALYFMPAVVLAIGAWSPILGFIVGCFIVLSFFFIFWLRSKKPGNVIAASVILLVAGIGIYFIPKFI